MRSWISLLVDDCEKLREESRALREAANVIVAESKEALTRSFQTVERGTERRRAKLKLRNP